MRLVFELSGESKSIPRAEVLALCDGVVAHELERILVVDVDTYDQTLGERLAMTHAIHEVKGICSQELESIYEAARSIELPPVRVAVRAKRIGHGLKSTEVEATIGKALAERGYEIDLSHPQVLVRVLLSNDLCVIGRTLASIDRSRFESRRPRVRPYFYPGVLLPRLARATVNLTRVKAGELLLDPFCGTGGILLEAGLLGAVVVGSDVDSRMVLGTKMNLDYYDVHGDLLVQDARALGLRDESVDAITTDLPYGRSVSVRARSLNQLKAAALSEMLRVLKRNARMVLISHGPIEDEVADAGFTVEGRHAQYVHKSLTREIVVARK
jgi:tRNA (guanine10-N2)-dimethyltransferase